MSEHTRLQQLEDREAIRDLLSRYSYAIARRDVDTVIHLFTDDCRVEILGQVYEGEAGLRELYRTSLAGEPKPAVHNHLIEALDADSARGRAVFEITQLVEGEAQTNTGCYEDRYVRLGGQWKFRQRSFRPY